MLARRLLALAARRPVLALARSFSAAAKKGDAASVTNADITRIFNELDATATAVSSVELPIRLTGRSGALIKEVYLASSKKAGVFDKIVKDLEAVVAVIQSSGLVIDRFFTTSNYSPAECKLVAGVLLTSSEPLTSFAGIKDADVRDLVVDNEGNLEAFRGARKALAALALSEEVKGMIDTLASEGRLDLVKKLAEKGADLRNAVSKSLEAVVTSSVALSKEQQAAIAKSLPNYAPAGISLKIKYTVDPAVLGGLLISLQNQTIDLSVSSRLVDVVAAARSKLA